MSNKYNDIDLNIPELFKRFMPEGGRPPVKGSIINKYMDGLTYKLGIRDRMIQANLILGWFYEFKEYWCGYLGNRPISVHDFHALRHEYRKAFQTLEYFNTCYSTWWEDRRMIYLLFGAVWNEAFNDLVAYKYADYIPQYGRVLEFGCGIAPISHSLLKYYRNKALDITAADIPGIMLHYARWRFSGEIKRVFTPVLDPDKPFLTGNYHVIFICQVLEHLHDPFKTMEYLHGRLQNNGILIFDYIKSEGMGLDTEEGVKQRPTVIKFIRQNYDIIKGNCEGETIARKR